MNAYKCDRCGKLFEKPPVEYLLENNSIYVKGLYTIKVEKIPDVYSHSIDLCFECYKKLLDFLEGGKNNG